MKKPPRTALIAACVLGGMIALAVLGSRLTVGADAYKSRFESAASDPLGLRVTVRGGLAVGFTGNLRLVMRDVQVRNSRGAEVLSADRAVIAVAILPLLFNQSHVHRIELVRPRIVIERDRDGVLNWRRREAPRGMIPVLARASVALTEGTVRYADERTGAAFAATGVKALVRGVRRGDRDPSILGGLSFQGKLECREVRAKSMTVEDVTVVSSARNGVLELDPITMSLFGGKGLASLRAELSDSTPQCRLRCSLSGFRIGDCLQTLSSDKIVTGAMDFAANVSSRGTSLPELKENLEGNIVLRGRQITLHGFDLDDQCSRLESSQGLDLAGIGSIFLVGPFGIAVAKGFDFARLIGHSGGNTQIRALVSSWDVKGGELRARDVAMATTKNRLALAGGLDFVQQRFDSVTVALVDKEGCAKLKQELRGSFKEPELTKPTVLTTLLGPARTVVTRVKGLLPGGPCTVFYAGSVEPPE